MVCHEPLALCRGCQRELPYLPLACPVCGIPQPQQLGQAPCPRCRIHPPAIDACIALLGYVVPADALISEFKYGGNLAVGQVLSSLLASKLQNSSECPAPDLLVPVPLHNSRLRQRGFNQAMEISRVLASILGVAVDCHSIKRIKPTQPQAQLGSVHQRRRNIRGAFSLARPARLCGVKHITLVDDVVTSMSTVNEIATLLKATGIGRVDVVSLARAGPETVS